MPFAIAEASYPGATLTTRSNSDGTFRLAAAEAVCDQQPPANVTELVERILAHRRERGEEEAPTASLGARAPPQGLLF